MSAGDGVADFMKSRHKLCAVLDLLHRVRHAVGTVHLNLWGGVTVLVLSDIHSADYHLFMTLEHLADM